MIQIVALVVVNVAVLAAKKRRINRPMCSSWQNEIKDSGSCTKSTPHHDLESNYTNQWLISLFETYSTTKKISILWLFGKNLPPKPLNIKKLSITFSDRQCIFKTLANQVTRNLLLENCLDNIFMKQ